MSSSSSSPDDYIERNSDIGRWVTKVLKDLVNEARIPFKRDFTKGKVSVSTKFPSDVEKLMMKSETRWAFYEYIEDECEWLEEELGKSMKALNYVITFSCYYKKNKEKVYIKWETVWERFMDTDPFDDMCEKM